MLLALLLPLYTFGKVSVTTIPLSFRAAKHQFLHARLEMAPVDAVTNPCRHSVHCVGSCNPKSLNVFLGHGSHVVAFFSSTERKVPGPHRCCWLLFLPEKKHDAAVIIASVQVAWQCPFKRSKGTWFRMAIRPWLPLDHPPDPGVLCVVLCVANKTVSCSRN